jgi:uncharacterized protein (UPF0261 family)/ABC-type branched-subunit amino acid transport system ATPase component
MATEKAILEINGLDVYYGRAHALQNISLRLDSGVLAVVGRNGMGKTTLCNAITGLVASTGQIMLAGEAVRGLSPNRIAELGIGYVPQGRRVWPSLTVDEHFRLASKSARSGAWTIKRVYDFFPRLAERRRNGGAQLSGGEQQMLAIGRALLLNPKLLVMDEPTEGLAPVIVDQVAAMLAQLAREGEVSVLLVEQNLGVAVDVADNVAVMVNGRIARTMPASELARDTVLQQRLLGVRGSDDEAEAVAESPEQWQDDSVRVLTIRRAADSEMPSMETTAPNAPEYVEASITRPRPRPGFTQWSMANPLEPADRAIENDAPRSAGATQSQAIAVQPDQESAQVIELPVAATARHAAFIAGTFDTKGRELLFIRNCLDRTGIRTITVDLSTSGKPSSANVSPAEVARHHPKGASAVFTNDRGSAVVAMALAFERYIASRRDVGGLISAGGSGGTSLATQAMRRLPIGIPKVMVSTVASGDVKAYVGPADICMMYSVTDVSGINRISEKVLSNAAHALAGMLAYRRREESAASTKPAIGLTMFGVTTPCVQAVAKQLEDRYDCLTFHATGTGGQSMEKLVASGLLAGVIDITTTEVADEFVGGVFSAGQERFESIIQAKVPYVGSCGALDMVNFHAKDTVPEKFRTRNLYVHNQNVTLMRTTPEENAAMGAWIAAKLNRMDGPVRFLLPEGGVSLIDAPGKPFWDPAANKSLFTAIESNFRPGFNRRLVRSPHNINDPEFADLLVKTFEEIMPKSNSAISAK